MKEKDKELYRSLLQAYNTKSTCARVQVSAIIVKGGRVVSTGWNGVPSGHQHCEDVFAGLDMTNEEVKLKHKEFSEKNEVHAEQNCLASAARNGVSTEGCTLIVSISPCTACAKLIIACGIKEVYYMQPYDRETYGLELLVKSGIKVEQI